MKWWSSVFTMELRKIFAYRTDFWVTFLGQTAIQLFIATALWKSVFAAQGTKSMQGFTLPLLTLYYLIVPLGNRILTGENMGFISQDIYAGTFTRYLIYPLSAFQFKSITYFTYSLFYAIQLAIIFSLFHIFYLRVVPDLFHLFLGIGLFFIAAAAYLQLSFAIELISLWADNIWSLMVMLRFIASFLGGAYLPLSFFPEWSLDLLKWTPFPYLVDLPVKTIMGLTSWPQIGTGVLILFFWLLFFYGVRTLVWELGQKSYTGVGI